MTQMNGNASSHYLTGLTSIQKHETFSFGRHTNPTFSRSNISHIRARKIMRQFSYSPFQGAMWKGLVPHRIELFTWPALLGKLNTRAKPAHLGIIPSSESLCVLCDCTESCNHLLIHCPFSRNLWRWWLELWSLGQAFPLELYEAFIQWSPPFKDVFFEKVWLASFSIIIWTTWNLLEKISIILPTKRPHPPPLKLVD